MAAAIKLAASAKLTRATALRACGTPDEMCGEVDIDGVAQKLMVLLVCDAGGPCIPWVESHSC